MIVYIYILDPNRLNDCNADLVGHESQNVIDNRRIFKSSDVFDAVELLDEYGLRLFALEERVTSQTAHVYSAVSVAVDDGRLGVGEVLFARVDERFGGLEADAVEAVQLDLRRLEWVDETFSDLAHFVACGVVKVGE